MESYAVVRGGTTGIPGVRRDLSLTIFHSTQPRIPIAIMPASFNDLPTEIKLLIVDWAHAMDEAAEARQRMDPQRRWDSVRECWIHRAKGAGRCNVLFRLDRELSEMAAPRVFQVRRLSPSR